jgi:hypothetical protein
MKIRTIVTIEVDEAEWMNAAGLLEGDVRKDVRSYIRTTLQDSPMFSQDTEAEVTVK